MAYTKTTFTNNVAPGVSATELNKIGDGIEEAHALAEAAADGASDAGVTALIEDDTSDVYTALSTWLVAQIADTGSAVYDALTDLIAARVSLLIVQYNSGWPSYSTDPLQVRIFLSQHASGASAPTYYNVRDLWFAYPEPVS